MSTIFLDESLIGVCCIVAENFRKAQEAKEQTRLKQQAARAEVEAVSQRAIGAPFYA